MKSMQLPLILVLAILLISEGAADAALHLHKDFVLKNESIVIGTEIRSFKPLDLEPNKNYEARVSFPSTVGVHVKLWLAGSLPEGGRHLLLAEKIMFRTDSLGNIVVGRKGGIPDVTIMFKAESWAVWKKGRAPNVLTYDIVLEDSTVGIPMSAHPIIVAVFILIVLSILIVPAWVELLSRMWKSQRMPACDIYSTQKKDGRA